MLARPRPGQESVCRRSKGEHARSPRFRDILVPMGMGDELRAALTVDGACWGMLCLHREARCARFGAAEIELLRQVRPHLGEGLQTGLSLATDSAPAG